MSVWALSHSFVPAGMLQRNSPAAPVPVRWFFLALGSRSWREARPHPFLRGYRRSSEDIIDDLKQALALIEPRLSENAG